MASESGMKHFEPLFLSSRQGERGKAILKNNHIEMLNIRRLLIATLIIAFFISILAFSQAYAFQQPGAPPAKAPVRVNRVPQRAWSKTPTAVKKVQQRGWSPTGGVEFVQCVDKNTDVSIVMNMGKSTADFRLMGNTLYKMQASYLPISGADPKNLIELSGGSTGKLHLNRSRKILYFREGVNKGTFCSVSIGNTSGSSGTATGQSSTSATQGASPSTGTSNNTSQPQNQAILPRLNGKKASIIFLYMGDSPFISFFQETIRLKKIMELYDFNVLLKHDNVKPWLDLSEYDERTANVKDVPTKTNLFSNIKRLADDGYTIDIWIISHGGTDGSFRASFGQYSRTSNDSVAAADIQGLAGISGGSTGYRVLPIRFVHHTSCWGSRLAAAWQAVGANTVMGSRYINFYPTQTIPFAKEWAKGRRAINAYRYANTATSRTVVQTKMVADAATTRKKWGGCSFGNTVLGKKSCAKAYFAFRYHFPTSEWSNSLSGKQNMNRASEMLMNGNQDLVISNLWRKPGL